MTPAVDAARWKVKTFFQKGFYMKIKNFGIRKFYKKEVSKSAKKTIYKNVILQYNINTFIMGVYTCLKS